MARSVNYFLSRLNKGEFLTIPKVLEALKKAKPITSREYSWTVVDVAEADVTYYGKKHPYLAGKLVKYDPNAVVDTVDEMAKKTKVQSEPNLQSARSLFVYFPDEAVFAHQHVWNQIRASDFRAHIANIITTYFSGFFADCDLKSLGDANRFVAKLADLKDISEIKANISPPNPLYSPLWDELKRYLGSRKLKRMAIKEVGSAKTSIPTQLPQIVKSFEDAISKAPNSPAPLGDAAVLMAVDGYGNAQITGKRDGSTVVVKTTDNAIQIQLDSDITPAQLAEAAIKEVVKVNTSRKLRH